MDLKCVKGMVFIVFYWDGVISGWWVWIIGLVGGWQNLGEREFCKFYVRILEELFIYIVKLIPQQLWRQPPKLQLELDKLLKSTMLLKLSSLKPKSKPLPLKIPLIWNPKKFTITLEQPTKGLKNPKNIKQTLLAAERLRKRKRVRYKLRMKHRNIRRCPK